MLNDIKLPDLSNGVPLCEVCGKEPMFGHIDQEKLWACRACWISYYTKAKELQEDAAEQRKEDVKKMILGD